MNFKALTSTKKYVIVLVGSVVVLLIAEALTFRQIGQLKESAGQVAQTLEREKAINTLFSHYSRMQAAEFNQLLIDKKVQDTSWEDQKDIAYTSFKSLEILLKGNPGQTERLRKIGELQDTFYQALGKLRTPVIDTIIVRGQNQPALIELTETFEAVRNLKDEMLLEERRMLIQKKKEFDTEADIAPLFTLLLVLFSLSVFLLAFARIYRSKERIRVSQEFLQSILRNTNNIVNYYEPVVDTAGTVKDFRIIFANESNRTYLGLDPEQIEGKLASRVFPFLNLNGELNELRRCYTTQKTVYLDRQISGQGKNMWFRTTIVPHADGILVTGTNTTREKEDEEKLRDLNEQLRSQNEDLLRAEAFLEGVLRSTKNVIMSFEPVWGDGRAIVDFKLVYINIIIEGIVDTRGYNLVGKKVSEISPMIFNSQVFRDMVKCYAEEKLIDFETTYSSLGMKHWLQGTAIRWHQMITLNLVDITKQIHAEQNLIKRNLELKRSNDELESFNRVASHDLQEPLRKIQMFLSRFFDTEKGKFSGEGKEYLGKVNKAAERMQSLIENLLSYSRIDKTHENFEEIDLNVILKKVKDDLALPIKETGAKIRQDKLPSIRGVLFQIEQLFLNLLSNALKYSKKDVKLKIVIRVEDVRRREISEDFIKTSRDYYKISVLDNGIGFDPANAHKIFEVFQRLHQKTEYSGTGIGLAICKKIMENHLGHIHAIGEQGEGSTFIMYFPHS